LILNDSIKDDLEAFRRLEEAGRRAGQSAEFSDGGNLVRPMRFELLAATIAA
jgi:hypothetical protein